ncbi:MAG: hypothetical protein WC770_06705 [Phycisphaerae bacterium]|jgi:hypothetical protein
MSATRKNIIIATVTVWASFFLAGCEVASNLATERESEKVVPAEFSLADTEGKIAVVVIQPAWIKTPMDLRVVLTDAFILKLQEKQTKIDKNKNRLIPYEKILKVRQTMPDDKKDSAFDIAGKLAAKYVIVVQIAEFDLVTFAEQDIYNGSMQARTCLYDANGIKLWPNKSDDLENTESKEESCRDTAVGIETEKGTVKTSVERLAMATAHCVVRHFYGCKKPQFKIAEEQKQYDSYTW